MKNKNKRPHGNNKKTDDPQDDSYFEFVFIPKHSDFVGLNAN